MLKLSKKEMLEKWLLLTRMEPLRADCRVTRSYGIDLEALAAIEMRMWYVNLMCHGPLEWLPVTDIAASAKLSAGDDDTLTVTLPGECMRPVSVRLYGWERPAPVSPPDSRHALMQTNPFARGGVCRPVAVLGRDGRTLRLHSSPGRPAGARLQSLMCVADPGDDTYIFHEDALSSIKPLQF